MTVAATYQIYLEYIDVQHTASRQMRVIKLIYSQKIILFR